MVSGSAPTEGFRHAMSLATFSASPPAIQQRTLTRLQAATKLGLNPAAIDKLVSAHALSTPIKAGEVAQLAGRQRLAVTSGELTVLRTDSGWTPDPARTPATETRTVAGFDTHYNDADVACANLRWWRADADRVLDNVLFAVTLGTVPVAVFAVDGRLASFRVAGESFERHSFSARLLARIQPGLVVKHWPGTPGHLQTRVRQIMDSTIKVDSGGPIGYLEP